MVDVSKKISGEVIIETMKILERGEVATCPLCDNGELHPINGKFENSHCFICSSCKQKLNIN